jgi:hypothetical protein
MHPVIKRELLSAFEKRGSVGSHLITSNKIPFFKLLSLLTLLHVPWSSIQCNVFEECIVKNAQYLLFNEAVLLIPILSGMGVDWCELQPATTTALHNVLTKFAKITQTKVRSHSCASF